MLHPDIGGLRPLFEDMARRLATHGLAVCAVEPFAGVAAEPSARPIEQRIGRVKDLDDTQQLEMLSSAADLLVVEDDVSRVCVLGFCMGGHYTFKAAADRPLRRRGRVLRDAAHARRLERARATRSSRSTVADRDVPDARDLRHERPVDARGRHRRAARRVAAAAATARSSSIEGAEHGFVHDPDAPCTAPTTRPTCWDRAISWVIG